LGELFIDDNNFGVTLVNKLRGCEDVGVKYYEKKMMAEQEYLICKSVSQDCPTAIVLSLLYTECCYI
jgi:hypothetical protein